MKKYLKYSFLIIIAGVVFLYFDYEAVGCFSLLIGGLLWLIYLSGRKKKNKSKKSNGFRYTATTWWFLENNS
jgi:hypothetical protein